MGCGLANNAGCRSGPTRITSSTANVAGSTGSLKVTSIYGPPPGSSKVSTGDSETTRPRRESNHEGQAGRTKLRRQNRGTTEIKAFVGWPFVGARAKRSNTNAVAVAGSVIIGPRQTYYSSQAHVASDGQHIVLCDRNHTANIQIKSASVLLDIVTLNRQSCAGATIPSLVTFPCTSPVPRRRLVAPMCGLPCRNPRGSRLTSTPVNTACSVDGNSTIPS